MFEFKLFCLLKYMMATFDVHKYSLCKINTYCINKPFIIFFYLFFILSAVKSLLIMSDGGFSQKESKFKYISILDKKKRR